MSISRNVFLIVFCVALLFFCVVFYAVNSSIGNYANGESLSVAKKFAINKKVVKLSDENISVRTSDSKWTIGELYAPFSSSKSVPVRSSNEPLLRSQWGPGQYLKSAFPGNGYVPGQCTWYVYNRRYQLHRRIGAFWGNGGMWHYSAARAGWIVNHSPEVGAVIDLPGHVALVEEIGTDNSVHISEMNYIGPYIYNERWIRNADSYWFIH